MAVYFADAVERFVEDMLEANADNLKSFETKTGVYSNVDPDTHHDVQIPDVHLTKEPIILLQIDKGKRRAADHCPLFSCVEKRVHAPRKSCSRRRSCAFPVANPSGANGV